MPSDEIVKSQNFDESGKQGMKQQLAKLTIWWDLKHYRRYTMAEVGWPLPVPMCVCFPVAIGGGKAFIQSPFVITKTEWDKAVELAKLHKYYAEVKWADKDPDINKWESELLIGIGAGAFVDEFGKLICNIVRIPDRVKGRFVK